MNHLTQIGVVISIKNDTAMVQIKRTSACGGKCETCGGCEVSSQKVEAYNTVGAKVGQVVRLDMKDTQVLFAAFMVYIVPLIMLFIGYAIGYSLFINEIVGVISGLLLLVASFLVIKRIDKKLGKSSKYRLQITQVLS
ncbi:MAG: sigma-E factor negative regulatory protein RseC [Clostridiales bacterium]|nr:sigma-E factor negative regulatory protein RseC [Clostridiales bacterium]MDK2933370.1 sigma-E factor negative regulatory protein RseC [Clostridiales bacterium]